MNKEKLESFLFGMLSGCILVGLGSLSMYITYTKLTYEYPIVGQEVSCTDDYGNDIVGTFQEISKDKKYGYVSGSISNRADSPPSPGDTEGVKVVIMQEQAYTGVVNVELCKTKDKFADAARYDGYKDSYTRGWNAGVEKSRTSLLGSINAIVDGCEREFVCVKKGISEAISSNQIE